MQVLLVCYAHEKACAQSDHRSNNADEQDVELRDEVFIHCLLAVSYWVQCCGSGDICVSILRDLAAEALHRSVQFGQTCGCGGGLSMHTNLVRP